MKTRKMTTLAMIGLLAGGNASAVDIVEDPGQIAQTIAGFAANHQDEMALLDQLVREYNTLQQTYQMVTSTYRSITGIRSFGDAMSLTNGVRNYLPTNNQDLQQVIGGTSGTYNRMGSMVQGYRRQNAILSDKALQTMKLTPQQQQQLTAQRNNAAMVQATAAQSMQAASDRFDYIQRLMDETKKTKDQKAIAELQARIAGEQTMLQNDQSKMQQMYAYLQNQERVTQLQNRELAIQQVGDTKSLTQPKYTTMK